MKKLLILIILLLVTCYSSLQAQEMTKQEAKGEASVPAVTQAQQQQITQALADADRAQLAADAADARRELAKTRAQALIFSIMATLKISPEEWRASFTKEGNLQFERIETASAAKSSPLPK